MLKGRGLFDVILEGTFGPFPAALADRLEEAHSDRGTENEDPRGHQKLSLLRAQSSAGKVVEEFLVGRTTHVSHGGRHVSYPRL